VLGDRTVLTAKKITEFLKESGDRFQKTIVFCVDEEHAARMRQALVNENADLVADNHCLLPARTARPCPKSRVRTKPSSMDSPTRFR